MLNRFVYLKNFDWILFSAVLLLVCFGLAEIYSIALSKDVLNLINFKKQIIFICLGVFLLFLFSFFDYHNLLNISKYLYILGLISLIALMFFGTTIRGSRSWFYFFGFGVQPVEFIKIILLIFLARFFSSFSIHAKQLKYLVVSGILSFLLIFLVLLQPDFGSAMILLSIWVIMLFIVGFNRKYFFVLFIIFVITFSASWFILFKPYQKERILTLVSPTSRPLDQGYNVAQAIIAVGAGRLSGRGLGFGSQSQLKFLPEAQNDFIFAVISEELGFLGVSLVIIFFSIFFYRCLRIVKKLNNDFAIFLVLGSAGLIFIEMFINIGMNIGILPVVGISLPFVSYGGSSMLANLILVGILEGVAMHNV